MNTRDKHSHPPSPEILNELLRYEPESGVLFWKQRDEKWFDKSSTCKQWNARRSGKPVAGAITAGYRRVVVLGMVYLQHRVVIAMQTGEWPDGYIDHINGNHHDNRLINLRVVDRLANNRNQGVSIKNKSGAVGVHSCAGKWTAQIRISGKSTSLGLWDTFEEASAARRGAEIVIGYHENHGQRPSRALSELVAEQSARGRP